MHLFAAIKWRACGAISRRLQAESKRFCWVGRREERRKQQMALCFASTSMHRMEAIMVG